MDQKDLSYVLVVWWQLKARQGLPPPTGRENINTSRLEPTPHL